MRHTKALIPQDEVIGLPVLDPVTSRLLGWVSEIVIHPVQNTWLGLRLQTLDGTSQAVASEHCRIVARLPAVLVEQRHLRGGDDLAESLAHGVTLTRAPDQQTSPVNSSTSATPEKEDFMNKSSLFTAPAALAFCLALLVAPSKGGAQTPTRIPAQQPAPPMAPPPEIKVMRELHGVKLDMTRAAVNDLLGKPKQTGKQLDEFKLDGGNLLTVRYGPQGKVRVIQFYGADVKRAPAWADVVGDAPIQTKPNGSKFARKVVSAEKFWVTMFQSKSGTLVTITISRQAN